MFSFAACASRASRFVPARYRIARRGYINDPQGKVFLKDLVAMKKGKARIAMTTAYDVSQGRVADAAGVDAILVGDSCANVVCGLDSTNAISLDAMVHHTKAVARGVKRAYLIGDMPFGTYLTPDEGVRAAARLVSEGGASMVKLEGCLFDTVQAISKFVPVCGHIGLLPQTADCFVSRGRTVADVYQLREDALRLQDAGCKLLVLEKVCAETSHMITEAVEIPTIGIACGPHCDGQVLVWHDLLGLTDHKFKFVRQYARMAPVMQNAVQDFVADVKAGTFPAREHSFVMPGKTRRALEEITAQAQRTGDGDHDFSKLLSVRLHDAQKPVPSTPGAAAKTRRVKSAAELRRLRAECERQGKEVVFVPFLGGLHEGHLALVEQARERCGDGQVWCSLFLNPTQFEAGSSDLATYPMNMDEDLALLAEAGVDVVFTPTAAEMYPVADEHFRPVVDFTNVASLDEARQRPGHFQGVGTVVSKLMAWVRPHKAIFGHKDYVQSVLVRRLCEDLFPDTRVLVAPTVREKDGLAMSSRNRRLRGVERERASLLYKTLSVVGSSWRRHLERESKPSLTVGQLRAEGEKYAVTHGVDIEYIVFHEHCTARQLPDDFVPDADMLLVVSVAGSVGPSTRLIDNVAIGHGMWDEILPMELELPAKEKQVEERGLQLKAV